METLTHCNFYHLHKDSKYPSLTLKAKVRAANATVFFEVVEFTDKFAHTTKEFQEFENAANYYAARITAILADIISCK